MKNASSELLFFCLGTGAALGCLLLLFRAVRILCRAGKLMTALLDILYCCLTAAAVFLCALAVDKGRLRLLQVLLQFLGGWAAVTALGPFVFGTALRLKKIFCKVSAFFWKKCSFFTAHFHRKKPKSAKSPEKTQKKRKKPKKKT